MIHFVWGKDALVMSITVKNKEVLLLEMVKLLGIILDLRLSWNPHIVRVTSKGKTVVLALKRLKGLCLQIAR